MFVNEKFAVCFSQCEPRGMPSHIIQWPGPPNESSGYVWLWPSCMCLQLHVVGYSAICKAGVKLHKGQMIAGILF
jgi:hypothetical protein